MVSVKYSDNFKENFKAYSCEVKNQYGSVEFVQDESRSAYFPAADLIATLSLTNTDNKSFTLGKSITDVQAQYPVSYTHLLNAHRLRRGNQVQVTTGLEGELAKEYSKEFLCEGQLWFYYKRTNTAPDYPFSDGVDVYKRQGITRTTSETDDFISPEDTRFEDTEELKKGSLTYSNTKSFNYDGEFSAIYGTIFAERHRLNVVGGASFSNSQSERNGYSVIGFPKGAYLSLIHIYVKNPVVKVLFSYVKTFLSARLPLFPNYTTFFEIF